MHFFVLSFANENFIVKFRATTMSMTKTSLHNKAKQRDRWNDNIFSSVDESGTVSSAIVCLLSFIVLCIFFLASSFFFNKRRLFVFLPFFRITQVSFQSTWLKNIEENTRKADKNRSECSFSHSIAGEGCKWKRKEKKEISILFSACFISDWMNETWGKARA